jgi:hypothetical protein
MKISDEFKQQIEEASKYFAFGSVISEESWNKLRDILHNAYPKDKFETRAFLNQKGFTIFIKQLNESKFTELNINFG